MTATTCAFKSGERRRFFIPLAIALLGLGIDTVVAAYMAPTIDEHLHVAYGAKILKGDPDRPSVVFDSKMPVSVLNALPRAASVYLERSGRLPRLAKILSDLRLTRWATITAAFCLCLVVFFYAQALFGRTAALFAELLFVMDPNIVAHGSLSTTDLFVALGAVLSLYCLRRFLLSPNVKNTALTAFTFALAQLTKFTALYFYAVLALILVVVKLYARHGRGKRYDLPWSRITALLTLSMVCFLVVVNAAFLFDRSFTPLAGYKFRTPFFWKLQQVPVLRAVPLPLPYAYVQGFDWMNWDNSTATAFGNIALLNQVRGPSLPRTDGFPAYYLFAYLFKEPIGMQIVLILSLVWIFRNRGPADLLSGEGLLLVCAIVILTPFSFLSRTQIGIRHVLPVLVIFAILSGAAFHDWMTFSLRRKLLLIGCLLYAGVSVGSYFPHMIPYFNEIVTDRRQAYRFLADSNLDWGQAAWEVQRFLKRNPDVVLNPPQRVVGRVLMSGNLVAGVWPRDADNFVRVEGLRPVAQVGYAYFLFVVPPRLQAAGASMRALGGTGTGAVLDPLQPAASTPGPAHGLRR